MTNNKNEVATVLAITSFLSVYTQARMLVKQPWGQ